jgi:hypothetical protein
MGNPELTVRHPSSLRGSIQVGLATFGPPLVHPGVTSRLVLVDDGVGSPTDACQPLTEESARQVRNRIALIDRGGCAFTTKVANAEAAGARAAVIADNTPGCPVGTFASGGGVDINIPSARISLRDGDLIKASLPHVIATLGINKQAPHGGDTHGRVRLFAEGVPAGPTTIIHWDSSATPNLLLEFGPGYFGPALQDVDLTPFQLADVGWELVTVEIDGCDSGLPDVPLPGGGRVGDLILSCLLEASNHGSFVRCVAGVGGDLRKLGLATGSQVGRLVYCASRSDLP